MKFARFTLLFFVLSCTHATIIAQSTGEVSGLFPGELAVMTRNIRETKIIINDGEPVATSENVIEMMMLDDRANGLYNKFFIYHGNFDQVSDIEAYTNVPDGNRFRKVGVTDIRTENSVSQGIFYDDVKQSVFHFPALVKGAVAHVSHRQFHKDLHLLSPFYFTSHMPVMESVYSISFPADMEVKYIIRNDPEGKIQVTEDKKGRQRSFRFTAGNLRSADRYSNSPARAYYEPHVIVYIASYNSGGNRLPFLGSVDDLYRWNSSFLTGINEVPSPELQRLADSLVYGAASQMDKARNIYRWVQQQIKYVAFEEGLEGFIPRQAADVCRKKYGDCKDMSSLLTALMKAAGLDAHFTWIGTRDIPYDYSEVHLPITDNHMISAVRINGEWLFLDGTDPNCEFGFPTSGIQGKQALIGIDPQHYEVVRVPIVDAERNVTIDSTFISISGTGITGHTTAYYKGYFGNDMFNSLQYSEARDVKEFVKSKLNKGSNKYILEDYAISHPQPGNKLVTLSASFQVPGYGKKVGDEYYINLHLDRFLADAEIDTAKRKVALVNDYRYSVTRYITLEIPEGYAVEYLPGNFSFANELFDFTIEYHNEGKKVVAIQQMKSHALQVQPRDFVKWNTAVKAVTQQYKEQLVLQKK
ncbi:MAG TPA: transglutaminase domain-containing protein [Chitinophagaceae bacterium]